MAKSKRIICAGTYRSGSTWLYNAVRLSLIDAGKNVLGYFYPDMHEQVSTSLGQYHYVVIKTHNFYKELVDAELIFTSIRDLHDIVASAIRKKIIPMEIKEVKRLCTTMIFPLYKSWKKKSDYIIMYEYMIKNKISTLERIAEFLEIDPDCKKVSRRIEQLKSPSDKDYDGTLVNNQYDSVSILNRNHMTDGSVGSYEKTLSNEIIDFINQHYHHWLVENGYRVKTIE